MAGVPRSIRASAVLLVLASVASLVSALVLTIAVAAFPSEPRQTPPSLVPLLASLIMPAWGGIATAIGIRRRRIWARYCMLILSTLGLRFSIMAMIYLLADPASSAKASVRGLMWAVYAPMFVASFWWLLLFNSPLALRYFYAEATSAVLRPAPLTLLGWWLVLDALTETLSAIMGFPPALYTLALTGWKAAAAHALIIAIQLLAARAILHLHPRAWPWAATYLVFYCGNVVTQLLVAYVHYARRVRSGVSPLKPLVTPHFAINVTYTIIALSAVLVLIWYRRLYLMPPGSSPGSIRPAAYPFFTTTPRTTGINPPPRDDSADTG